MIMIAVSEIAVSIIAITVSTNYDDLLKIIMPQNYKFFDKWYIITNKDDEDTIKIIKYYNFNNIEILFFDFYANNNIFNKGGAIRFCQEQININYNGNILILDSDIFLPNNFDEIINNISIKDDTLYGTYQRNDFYSYTNFINKKIDSLYWGSLEFHGYFQLYKFNKNFLYEDSYNCSCCDLIFHKYFQNKEIIKDLTVSHLGERLVNWNGRKYKTDFLN